MARQNVIIRLNDGHIISAVMDDENAIALSAILNSGPDKWLAINSTAGYALVRVGAVAMIEGLTILQIDAALNPPAIPPVERPSSAVKERSNASGRA